jgi:Transglycosylase SLT domain
VNVPRGAALGLAAATIVVTVLVPAGPAAATAIPGRYLTWYRAAARTCPGLTWEVLAGIGTMESDNGQSTARGVHSGKNRKGAEGPMQFEPATFAEYAVRADRGRGRGRKLSPYDPKDAIFTAARMLCADGAAGGSARGLRRAIFAYNHAHWYVRDVLAIAARYTAAASRGRHRAKGRRRPSGHRSYGHHGLGHRSHGHRGQGHRGQGHRGHRGRAGRVPRG